MKERTLLVLALLSGFVGGIVGAHFGPVAPAHADKKGFGVKLEDFDEETRKQLIEEIRHLQQKESNLVPIEKSATCGHVIGMYAEEFHIKDKAGISLATFSDEDHDSETQPVLQYWDSGFKTRMVVGLVKRDTPFIAMNDASGNQRVRLALDEAGNGSLTFYDSEGRVTREVR